MWNTDYDNFYVRMFVLGLGGFLFHFSKTSPVSDTSQKQYVSPQKICKNWSYIIYSSSGESRRYLFVWLNNHKVMTAGGYFPEGLSVITCITQWDFKWEHHFCK